MKPLSRDLYYGSYPLLDPFSPDISRVDLSGSVQQSAPPSVRPASAGPGGSGPQHQPQPQPQQRGPSSREDPQGAHSSFIPHSSSDFELSIGGFDYDHEFLGSSPGAGSPSAGVGGGEQESGLLAPQERGSESSLRMTEGLRMPLIHPQSPLSDDCPLLTSPSPLLLYASRLLLTFSREAWDLAIPLVLVHVFPSNILAVALYCLVSATMLICLSPLLAFLFSRASSRLLPLSALALLQLSSLAGSSLCLLYLLWLSTTPFPPQQFWDSWRSCLAFLGHVLFGSLTAVCTRLLDNVVDLEWVSLLYSRSERAAVLSRLETLTALSRVAGPVASGLLLSEYLPQPAGLFAVIGLAVAPLFPSFGCLWRVASAAPGYRVRTQLFWRKRFPNPVRFLIAEWPVYSNQAVFRVMITNSLLWISIFNPHSFILVAILKCYDFTNRLFLLGNPVLGGVRGVGALFGWVLGPLFFSRVMLRIGLIPATQFFVAGSAVAALCAALVFQLASRDFLVLTILFLCFLVLEESFTCGFSSGEQQILQAGVPKKWRNTLHVAQVALTDIALFSVNCGATVLSSPPFFPYLIWAAFATISIAAVLFGVWSLNRTNRNIVLLGPMLLDSNQEGDSLAEI